MMLAAQHDRIAPPSEIRVPTPRPIVELFQRIGRQSHRIAELLLQRAVWGVQRWFGIQRLPARLAAPVRLGVRVEPSTRTPGDGARERAMPQRSNWFLESANVD